MKSSFAALASLAAVKSMPAFAVEPSAGMKVAAKAKVYMTTEISPAALVKIYEALGRQATGKVAVKISTGEPGGHNFLQPALIQDLVKKVNGTIVECNTAYAGKRSTTEAHLQTVKDHGFAAIAPVDIMDAEGEIKLPVKDQKHLKYNLVALPPTARRISILLARRRSPKSCGTTSPSRTLSSNPWLHRPRP